MTLLPNPLILAFDTSGKWCVAALLSGTRVLAEQVEEMTKGQAERLMPMLTEMLDGAGVTWADLAAIGVGTGPGNFTGIRIAVSAARGLALGLNIPAIGITACEARAFQAPSGACSAIPAPRDMVYLCRHEAPNAPPELMPHGQAQAFAAGKGLSLIAENSPQGLAEAIARIAAKRWQVPQPAPAPLYARAADAAPSRHTAPTMLD
ncbi:MAG: tRNA (adenosine(37)-N6)-threonylcarbamoyltransferase complex dimerization subunit type 1 TsaB [Rhodobacteraceae bacterium]|nr:tRNA (adenosine(37)-N6)-threonylcarbamoyltransferase complex dimerization subunit type 1 TsaB [Paracoccaceae bacterium]